MITEWIDIGYDHFLYPATWKPDRDLNPDLLDVPDIPLVGYSVYHPSLDGVNRTFSRGPVSFEPICCGFVRLDLPEVRQRFGEPIWEVESLDPLTISPSVLCRACGDHGWIKQGKWIPA